MNKFSILLAGVLALTAVSCDDEAPAVPPMQANPQQPILEAGDVEGAVAGVLASTETFSLEDASSLVPVFTLTKAEDLPAGATVTPVLELSNDAAFGKVETLGMSEDNGVFTVSAADWNTAHIKLFGKSPKVKTAYYRVPMYVTYDGTQYRYNSPDWYAVTGSVNETCMDAGFVIYDHYYFLSDATTWNLTAADVAPYAFKHSDADVYDDPVFTLRLEITQDILDEKNGAVYWKIASQGAVDDNSWNLVYGPEENGDENFVGTLVGDGAAQAGKFVDAGKYDIAINMEEMTYTITAVTRPEFVAVPSNANGWGQDGPRLYWSNKDDKPYFCGAARVNNTDGGFKFIWDNNWFGGRATSETGGIIDAAEGNIPAPADATNLYWFTVSTENMTYTITPVESVALIGGFNGWDVNNLLKLTPSEDLLVWTGEATLNGEWKVIINGDWTMSYGGPELADPTYDGGNFNNDGTYAVTVDFSGNHPVITMAAK